MSPDPLDLLHGGAEHVIGSYVLDTDDGPALFDCGPTTCVAALKAGLRTRGLDLQDVRHLLLSHIHLDHAGAAGVLVREHPELQVHVSAVGAPHLVDPSRLEASARRLYGEAFDDLWGELAPVPEENVRIVGRPRARPCVLRRPADASHHVSYVDDAGTLYAGDAAGVRHPAAQHVSRPLPRRSSTSTPWLGTLDEIERRAPTAARPHPLRRRRRCRPPPRRAAAPAAGVGRARGCNRTGVTETVSRDVDEATSARCRSGSPTPG
jgi:glyoxylase-like metal-dependent hydrolase (beta-lactamase superfamily II)